ncbi:hypothetical protein ACHAXS_013642 [Conticribra weissflogii]
MTGPQTLRQGPHVLHHLHFGVPHFLVHFHELRGSEWLVFRGLVSLGGGVVLGVGIVVNGVGVVVIQVAMGGGGVVVALAADVVVAAEMEVLAVGVAEVGSVMGGVVVIVFEGEHFVHVHFVDGLWTGGAVVAGGGARRRDGSVGGAGRPRGVRLRRRSEVPVTVTVAVTASALERDPGNGLELGRHHVGPVAQKLPHDRALPRRRHGQNSGQPVLRPVAGAHQQVGLRGGHGGRLVGGGEELGRGGGAGGDASSRVVAVAALIGAAGQGGEHAAEGVVHGEEVDVVADDGPRLDGLAHRDGVDHVRVVLEERQGRRGDGHDQPVVGVAAAAAIIAALAARARVRVRVRVGHGGGWAGRCGPEHSERTREMANGEDMTPTAIGRDGRLMSISNIQFRPATRALEREKDDKHYYTTKLSTDFGWCMV